MNRYFSMPLKTFIVLVTALLIFSCGKESRGQAAPDFTLKDMSGNDVTLSDYMGKVVLLDFWATWCPPCRKSIPELVALNKKYKNKGLVILGISIDDPARVSKKYLAAFIRKFKINYTVLRSDNQIMRKYFNNARVSIPTMFVINREGKIVDMHVGFRPGVVERSIKKVIR